MYENHFGLNLNPFGLSPKLDFLYRSGGFEESMAHLLYGLDNSEAIVMITGRIGTGKTMAIQSFLSNLGERFAFALLTNTRINSLELLKMVLDDLGIEYPAGADKSDLLIRFKEFLVAAHGRGQRVLIVIDEAQNLDRDVLEEVRLLTNLGQGESQPVQVILVGQPELETVVRRPDLAQLLQRIRVHCRVSPLDRAEVEAYIEHRMAVAGCRERVFEAQAIDRIFALTGGVPRLVNTLASDGLLAAYVAGKRTVRACDIEDRDDLAPAPGAAQPAAVAPPPQPIHREEPRRQEAPGPAPAYAHRPARRRRLWPWLLLPTAAAIAALLHYAGIVPRVFPPAGPAEPRTAGPGASPAEVPVAVADTDTRPEAANESAPAQNAEEARPEPARTTNASSVPEGPGFAVHISSFRDPARSEVLRGRLESYGHPVLVRERTLNGAEWYRVYLGPYPDRPAANADIEALSKRMNLGYTMIVSVDDLPEDAAP